MHTIPSGVYENTIRSIQKCNFQPTPLKSDKIQRLLFIFCVQQKSSDFTAFVRIYDMFYLNDFFFHLIKWKIRHAPSIY